MASVFKRGRWIDAQGRKCRKETPGATWQESRYWTVKVYIDGKPRLLKGYTDKAASEQMGAKIERDKAKGEQGLIDPYKAHRGRPLAQHVADWTAELRALGRDDMYIAPCDARLTRLMKECGWAKLADISADAFCCWRETAMSDAGYRAKTEANKRKVPMGARTKNHYLETLRAFCRWAVKRGRMAGNPIATVDKVDQTADVRRARRALSEDELVRMLAVIPDSYQLVYRTILATGLRRDELRQLRWGDVKLNAPAPVIQLRAETTKAGRGDILPVRSDLAGLLREARGDAEDGAAVFPNLPTMDQHRSYLASAGISYVDEQGRRADFHALRHTFGTQLSKAGVAPRVAMELMRHTSMALTMRVYTDPRIFDLAGAVELLPALTPSSAQQATGTYETAEAAGRTQSVTYPLAEHDTGAAGIGKYAQGANSETYSVNTGDNACLAGTGGDAEKSRRWELNP